MSQYIDDKYLTDMVTFGESYMEGLWDADDLEETLYQMSLTGVFRKMLKPRIRQNSTNLDRETSQAVIDDHYDLGNELFVEMLGETLTYSCAYWQNGASNLDEAQRHKLQLIADKLEIEDGMSILDLGCGWGAFGKYLKEAGYNVDVLGVTLSEEQAKIARQHHDVLICDYREARGKFDRVLSIGLFEHVGSEHYRDYMRVTARCLERDGIAFIHTNGLSVSHKLFNPWVNKYIFPYGMMPSLKQIAEATERRFVIEDVHNIGLDYVPTLRAWWDNCKNGDYFNSLPEKFRRMWKFYLLFSAASFRHRDFQLYHVVMTKHRNKIPERCK